MTTGPSRTRADDFLEACRAWEAGRLKLYIGVAAGVGKTYRIAEEAHALPDRGVDIVIASSRPTRAADTIALVDGLEVVPRRQIEYRASSSRR